MKNQTFVRWASVLALGGVVFTAACRENPFEVGNPNNPDVERALATAPLAESFISKTFQQIHNGLYQTGGDNLWSQTIVMGFESSSALGNFGMGARSAIPRTPIDNSIGNNVGTGNFRDYDHLSRNARQAANGIRALRDFNAAGLGISAGGNARAISFAYFSIGFALGHLSMVYDSVGVVTPEFPTDSIPPLSPASFANTEALRLLDSALAYAGVAPQATPAQATAATGTGGWPIPASWWNGPAAIDRARWIQIIRSYKARIRVGVARTPAEHKAVNWNTVIADATNGITSNLIITASVSAGWSMLMLEQLRLSTTWSQMTPFYLGMGDTTDAFANWLSTPVNSTARQIAGSTWLMRTPDKRFPSGATRAVQQAVSPGRTGPGTTGTYFRNRPAGDDDPGFPWGTWQYDLHRFWLIGAAGGNGDWVAFSVAENDLLAAEGYLETGQPNLAIPLINKTRVANGLLTIPPGATTVPAPGGPTSCVPRVPQPPTYTVLACGSLFEALKWEKRLETAFTGYAQWYIDARGWGDLYAGTPLEWAVPYQETFARYGTGEYYFINRPAAVGTYGYGNDPNF